MENPFGYFTGARLVQGTAEVGASRDVFVHITGNHNDMVYPPIGGVVKNPPKGSAKMFAGDLCEFRPQTNTFSPEIFILRTFKVVSASGTTVNVERSKFSHKPFVGDILMVAPQVIGGQGTAVTVTAVSNTKVGEKDVWALTVSSTFSANEGDILVEGEASGSTNMLVKKINGVFPSDATFYSEENVGGVENDDDYYKSRYFYTPQLGGLMWTNKMSPLPQCVLDLNVCNVDGWFHVSMYLDGTKLNKTSVSQTSGNE